MFYSHPKHIEWLYYTLLTYGRSIDIDTYVRNPARTYFIDSINAGYMTRTPEMYCAETGQIYTITDKGLDAIRTYHETHS